MLNYSKKNGSAFCNFEVRDLYFSKKKVFVIVDSLQYYGLWVDFLLVFAGTIGSSVKAVATRGCTSEYGKIC